MKPALDWYYHRQPSQEIDLLFGELLNMIPDEESENFDPDKWNANQTLALTYMDDYIPDPGIVTGNQASCEGMAKEAEFVRYTFMHHAFEQIFMAIVNNPRKSPVDICNAYLLVVAKRKVYQKAEWEKVAYEAQYLVATDLLDIYTKNTLL